MSTPLSLEAFDELLGRTLDDGALSRGERLALRARLEEAHLDANRLALFRSRAFAAARSGLDRPAAGRLDWLEEVLKLLLPAPERASRSVAHFSPGDDSLRALIRLFDGAARHADVCVFTITDDRISAAIERAHRRGVGVRIVTDDDKRDDRGSDIDRLSAAGIPVRQDRSAAHMHHKFALFDRTTLVTGSYNWTRSAARSNQENLIIVDDQRLVRTFQAEFDRLWEKFVG